MELTYKSDCSEALSRWKAFWHGDLLGRPPTVITVRRQGAPEIPRPRYLEGLDGDFQKAIDRFEDWAETIYFAGEAFPAIKPRIGPDQGSSFMGGTTVFSEKDDTSWVLPTVDDWSDAVPLRIDPNNCYWRHILAFYREAARRATDKYLVRDLDMDVGLGALAALRGFQRFCFDMVDQPELVDELIYQVIPLFEQVYEAGFHTGGMEGIGWTIFMGGMVCPGKGETLCCDFCALISPEMFRRWVMPSLRTHTEYLNHTFFHLDGPDALVHLPDLLSLRSLHGVQWVPGSGLAAKKPQHTWVDLFQTIQEKGKAVQVWGSADEIKWIHPQLKPELTTYMATCSSSTEADKLLTWLCRNS